MNANTTFLNDDETRRRHLAMARRLVFSRQDAEDVVQTAYIKFLKAEAARKARGAEPPENAMLFLNRIVFNEAINLIRKKKRSTQEVSMPEWYDCADRHERPEEAFVHQESVERLHVGMARLTPHQVQLLKQRHLEELTQAQLEQCHNVTRRTIYNRLQTIYGTLRPIIDGNSHEIS